MFHRKKNNDFTIFTFLSIFVACFSLRNSINEKSSRISNESKTIGNSVFLEQKKCEWHFHLGFFVTRIGITSEMFLICECTEMTTTTVSLVSWSGAIMTTTQMKIKIIRKMLENSQWISILFWCSTCHSHSFWCIHLAWIIIIVQIVETV